MKELYVIYIDTPATGKIYLTTNTDIKFIAKMEISKSGYNTIKFTKDVMKAIKMENKDEAEYLRDYVESEIKEATYIEKQTFTKEI